MGVRFLMDAIIIFINLLFYSSMILIIKYLITASLIKIIYNLMSIIKSDI